MRDVEHIPTCSSRPFPHSSPSSSVTNAYCSSAARRPPSPGTRCRRRSARPCAGLVLRRRVVGPDERGLRGLVMSYPAICPLPLAVSDIQPVVLLVDDRMMRVLILKPGSPSFWPGSHARPTNFGVFGSFQVVPDLNQGGTESGPRSRCRRKDPRSATTSLLWARGSG